MSEVLCSCRFGSKNHRIYEMELRSAKVIVKSLAKPLIYDLSLLSVLNTVLSCKYLYLYV